MCGIAGAAWVRADRAVSAETVRRMTDALTHRGPDDQGQYFAHVETPSYPGSVVGCALGHRRLSIIDVAGGQQPLSNEDGSIWVTFNGEIYNFPTLRRRLEGGGHTLRTNSDTEVLVHLYEDLGVEFLQHLNGMFALAIWDGRSRQLVLARDRLGKKPLVYRHDAGQLLFGSELKAILSVPDVPRAVDPGAIDAYLTYQYVPHPQTIFQGIHKLSPGHYAVYRDGELQVAPYWQPDFRVERERPYEEYAAEVRELLTSAVEIRLQSEVPLGAFLSGGVDSSIVVALMQQLVKEPVRTFSIGFKEPEYDETSYAREVAQHLGTRHEEFRVTPNAIDILPKLVWHFDEPFADSSAIPTWYVSQLTRQHVTVALTGDGGDELFAGYPRYRAADLAAKYDQLPAPIRAFVGAQFWQRLPGSVRQKSPLRRFKRLVGALSQEPVERFLDWSCIFNFARRAELYDDAFLATLPAVDPAQFLRTGVLRSAGRDPITAFSLADLTTYLPCDLMTKVDIASMAHSLECRQPFLDYRLVELAAATPVRYKYRRGRGKRILLDVFGGLLPQSVGRRAKMGFGVPLDHWFRNELRGYVRDVLLDRRTTERGYFRTDVVQQLIDDHQAGRFDHAYRLWALLVLELWHREWIDGATGR
jgi:asparagine synthase (glutamine-hydrolysing)